MHYVNWQELCLPRYQGGLGFRDLAAWRGPLRARIAWMALHDVDSLLYKAVKAKYGLDFQHVSMSARRSSTWQVIHEGVVALETILRWRIGDGRDIRLLQKCWILDRKFERWPTFVNVEEVEEASVSQLLDGDMGWNTELVERCFGQVMAQRILAINNGLAEGNDLPELSQSCIGSSLAAAVYRSKLGEYHYPFCWLSKQKLHPRENFHWWRLLRNALPTNLWLARRGLASDESCLWGCNVEESVDHCANRCRNLREIFGIPDKWGISLPVTSSLGELLFVLGSLADTIPSLGQVYCYSVYQVRRARNDLKHTGACRPLSIIVVTVLSLLLRSYRTLIQKQWSTHQPSRLYHHKHWDAFQADVLAATTIREVVKDWMLELDGIIIEGDCANTIKWLQNLHDRKFGGHYNFEGPDLSFLLEFKQVLFQYSHRDSNRSANFCANLALTNNFVLYDINAVDFPPSLLPLLREDSTSV
ncbi:putative mitochondrial protein [Dendrobium catenatum]|uniref:Putative mitochondrial protein n=1 Tax=Dendrobium catenatum TaxID=906689 RepID=A0A2I0VBN1_9ASPA|nr:putative mitochondrial protein [Dendrobium catenatum]